MNAKRDGRLAIAAVAIIIFCNAAATPCRAQLVGLGQAASYGVFMWDQSGNSNTGTMFASGGSTSFNGPSGPSNPTNTWGMGANTTGNLSGLSANVVQGALDLSQTGTSGYTATPFTGGIQQSSTINSQLSTAQSNAVTAATQDAALTPTQTITTLSGGTTITGNGGLNVVDITSVSQTSGNITISGNANNIFIFNVSNSFTANNGTMILTGGVTANHILWNYTGTGTVTIQNGTTSDWYGTLLTVDGNFSLHDRIFDGAVISGGNITITSNATFNNFAFSAVPEPGSLLLGAVVTVACGAVGYRQRRRPAV
jgi:hypothetical protein